MLWAWGFTEFTDFTVVVGLRAGSLLSTSFFRALSLVKTISSLPLFSSFRDLGTYIYFFLESISEIIWVRPPPIASLSRIAYAIGSLLKSPFKPGYWFVCFADIDLESSPLTGFTYFFSSTTFGFSGSTDLTRFEAFDSSTFAVVVFVAAGLGASFFGACWESNSRRSGPLRSLSLNVLTS